MMVQFFRRGIGPKLLQVVMGGLMRGRFPVERLVKDRLHTLEIVLRNQTIVVVSKGLV